MSLSYSYSILELIESKANKNEQIDDDELAKISAGIEQIDLYMLAYLRNMNYYLEEIHEEYYGYFKWLLVTVFAGGAILIWLNGREIKKRDKIIYTSEQFLKHSMEVQEAERRRISRELHDTVAQNMRYVSLLAENLSEKESAQNIISTQNKNIDDIRKLCYNLTPPNISGDDMVSALELLGQKIFELDTNSERDSGDFELRIVAEDSVDFSAWNNEQLMNIYRIVQEAFQNIKKHAEASEVTVLFKAEPPHLKIIITDDGKGMSSEVVNQINNAIFENTKNSHFGVRNIAERVQLLGGTVTYRSEPDCGTQITAVL